LKCGVGERDAIGKMWLLKHQGKPFLLYELHCSMYLSAK